MATCTFQEITATGGLYLWSTVANWVDGAVPVGGDSVVVPIGTTATFDADQTGFTVGLADLTVDGIFQCATAAGAYRLKMTGTIVGAGTFGAGSLGTPLPADVTFVVEYTGNGSLFAITTGMISLYEAEPTTQVVRIAGATEVAGQTELSVDTDVTGVGDVPWWAAGALVSIVGPSVGGVVDVEWRTIASATAATITVTAGLTADKPVGSLIALVSRNITVIGAGSGVAFDGGNNVYGADWHLGCAIRAFGSGIASCTACTVTGPISGCSVQSGSGGGLASCTACTVTGPISGCSSQYGGGGLASCTACTVTGPISGCSAQYGGGLYDDSSSVGYGASFLDNTPDDVFWDSVAGDALYLFQAYCYGGTPNDTRAWSTGGTVTHETSIVPTGHAYSHKFIGVADYWNRLEWKIGPNKVGLIAVQGFAKHDATGLTSDQRIHVQIIDPASDPLYGGTSLAEWIAADSTNWQTAMVRYTATGDRPLIIRICQRRASGNSYARAILRPREFPGVMA